jgi:ribonuclease HI
MPQDRIFQATLFFDGGSRGNPGIAAGAAVIVFPDGKTATVSKFLPHATNNDAEYTGLIIGLEKARELGINNLSVKGDSNLAIEQVSGRWKINNDRLRQLCRQAQQQIQQFNQISLTWIPREENKLADAAVNQCLDENSHNPPRSLKTATTTTTDSDYLKKLIALGDRAKFHDYRKLKSGRDQFTAKNLAQLQEIIPPNIQQQIQQQWEGNEQYLAKVYRWFLRGLPPEMAVQKVIFDAETEAKFTGSHPWKAKSPVGQ